MSNTIIKGRMFRASAAVGAGFFAAQAIRLVGNLISTRILAPELFGVMALASAYAAAATMLADAGLSLNVLRHEKGEDSRFLKTTFSLKVIQGAALTIFLMLFAAAVGALNYQHLLPSNSVYANPDLPPALLILAMSAFIRGFASIEIELNRRRMKFGRVIVIELLSQTAGVLFVVLYGSVHQTIYALALASAFSTLIYVVSSHLLFSSRKNLGFAWDRIYVREILHFGKWIAGSSIVGLVSQHGDKMILGLLLNPAQMGMYAIAQILVNALNDLLKKTNTIWLPVFGEAIRSSSKNISGIYYDIRFYRDLLICSAAGILVVGGDSIVSLLYDERYRDAGWMLQLLSISFFINAPQLKGQMLTAEGLTKKVFLISLQRALSVVVLIPVFYIFFGIPGAILAFSLRYLAGSWMVFSHFHKKGYLNIGKEVRAAGAIVVGLVVGVVFELLLNAAKYYFLSHS